MLSFRRCGERSRGPYPIAQTAIDALADLAPLGETDDDAVFAIALDTSDPDLRNAIFRLLAKTGGRAMQTRLFDVAVEPGRAWIRSSAAHALLDAVEQLDQVVVDKITPRLIATRYEPIAGVLAILLSFRGDSPRFAWRPKSSQQIPSAGCSCC
jgi:hypothetical protein